jgi:hypothetical protein
MFLRYFIQTGRFLFNLKEFKEVRKSMNTNTIKLENVPMENKTNDIVSDQGDY